MVEVVVAMDVRVADTAAVLMLVCMERDVQGPPKAIGDAAQGRKRRKVIAALESRDHRFRHAEPVRDLTLRLARSGSHISEVLSDAVSDVNRRRTATWNTP